jgi:hypothetical protein
MKKYYGDREVESVSDIKENGFVDVKFIDGTSIELKPKMVESVLTDESIDLTKLREKRCFPVVVKILELFLDFNVKIDEIDFITQRVILSINESCKNGNDKLWGSQESDRTMNDVHQVLIKGEIETPYKK